MSPKPDTFPIRKVADGNWEVLITQDDRWHSCVSEEHARLISLAPVYEHECTHRLRTGLDFANELEQLANAFEKNGLRFGAGFFRDSAEQARG